MNPNPCILTSIKKITLAQQIASNQMRCREIEKIMQVTSTLAGALSTPSNYPLLIDRLKIDSKNAENLHNRIKANEWLLIYYVNDLDRKCNKKYCKPHLNKDQIIICINIVKSNIALIEFQQIINKIELKYMNNLLCVLYKMKKKC